MTYIRAITARKWNDACAARVARERKELADVEGSCEAALRGLFTNRPAAFANLDVGDVRRRGDQIAVDLVQPGQDQPVETLFLEREGASWQVTDLDDRYAF